MTEEINAADINADTEHGVHLVTDSEVKEGARGRCVGKSVDRCVVDVRRSFNAAVLFSRVRETRAAETLSDFDNACLDRNSG